MSNITNENTLFRFVSLRSPDLVKEEGLVRRFVIHPTLEGVYFDAVASRPGSSSKWVALKSASAAFSAYHSDAETKTDLSEAFYKTAEWIAQHRSSFDKDELFAMVNHLPKLTDIILLKLWDNLFYQVVTQNLFYVKEVIMHALVLDNLLRQLDQYTTDAEKKEHLAELVLARVILPTELFDEGKTLQPRTDTPESLTTDPAIEAAAFSAVLKSDPLKPVPSEIKDKILQAAAENVRALEKAKKEIIALEKRFGRTYEKAYKDAVDTYEALIAPLIKDYNDEWITKKRAACKTPLAGAEASPGYCAEPDITSLNLPKFIFSLQEPVTDLDTTLSAESYALLENFINKNSLDSLRDIKDFIDEESQTQQQIILENTDFTEPVMLAGGIAFPLNQPKVIPIIRDTEPVFVPEKFGVRRLGIADYKKVVSHVCCYSPGEVAHIENIMAKEFRSKTTTRERVEETTETTETSQETENLTDNTSTERFQMQSEISKILQQQREAHADVNFQASWGAGPAKYSLDTGGGFSSSTSKEESNRQAVSQSKEITQRAMERVVTKIRTEIIRKTTDSFKEENVHAFDNRAGSSHVSGVFRFINAVYKNQIYNYGKRLMYEFMIPQPSKMHRLGMMEAATVPDAPILQKPVDPRALGYTSFSSINEGNYATLAANYGADVEPPMPAFIYLDFAFSKDNINPAQPPTYPYIGGGGYAGHTADFKIPDGYEVYAATGAYLGREMGVVTQHPKVAIVIGGHDGLNYQNTYEQVNGGNLRLGVVFFGGGPRNVLHVSVSVWDERAFTVNINAECHRTDDASLAWKAKTYKAIMDGYNQKLEEYNSSVTDPIINATNPGFYRQTEQMVLRKNCIAYLLPDEQVMGQSFYSGTDLKTFKIAQTSDLDNYTALVKFLEQGFEWGEMSYSFYPWYWANRNEWNGLYQYDCDDPLFRSFMQSGMARVIVTVKPGFEDAMMLYMSTGQIWNGGQVPVIGDPLYLSIVDELAEQEYVVEETWDTVVPTSLVALQNSGVAINASGLPCGAECADHAGGELAANNASMTGNP